MPQVFTFSAQSNSDSQSSNHPARLHYTVYEPASPSPASTEQGRTMVLIHGLSGSAHWWRRNIPVFAQHYRVYVLELTGYGAARRQVSLNIRQNAELVAAWMDAMNLENVALMGHSMGGHIALRVAELRPERLSHLVLACASGLLRGQVPRLIWRLPHAGLTGRPSFVPRILLDSARAGLPNLWQSGASALADDVSDLLPLLSVRTLVIWGARDALIPAALGRQLAAVIPGAQYIEIPRAGHVVMVDAPAEFNREVLQFLEQDTV